MQQQPSPTLNSATPFPSNNITTEQIQKYLEDNKKLIMAILEFQNLGKLNECAQYQALLQKNLMYLAAIADAQPQPSTPSQMPPNTVAQQGNYIQQPQSATPQQQVAGPRMPFQLNALRPQDQQQQLLHFQQQQQHIQGHAGLRPGTNNSMHGMRQAMQSGTLGNLIDARGSQQEVSEAGSAEGHGRSASGRGGGNREA
ncbi:hypothetical protein RJ639_001124 [Escallonia herrerae]|uniref:SS18 N-terminal domain-containing protein n=1 Tax=Escallonia herrerae TaxID=1293975 RepID=A0AA88XAW9_9ASTE|nr:hypothetical protein RJ639_001124 [Escallonia herrerae]